MIRYFAFGVNIAAVEDAAQAAKFADAGWREINHAAFMKAWSDRDAQALAAVLAGETETAPLKRAVGEKHWTR